MHTHAGFVRGGILVEIKSENERCPETYPDEETVQCAYPRGHAGYHEFNSRELLTHYIWGGSLGPIVWQWIPETI